MHPTYFETVTAMALVVFRGGAARTCVVLEVGLGGRLDATNVVQPEVTVVTPVDFDHEALLGRSLEAIAAEKAGILKPGVPAVFARQRPGGARVVLEARAAELGVPVRRTRDWPVARPGARPRAAAVRPPAGLRIRCPLAGEHQVENAVAAAMALWPSSVSPARAIEEGIAATRWPGRLERVAERARRSFSTAPTIPPARARWPPTSTGFTRARRIWMIYGAMRDKAIAEMSGILFPRAAPCDRHGAPAQARAVRPEDRARHWRTIPICAPLPPSPRPSNWRARPRPRT